MMDDPTEEKSDPWSLKLAISNLKTQLEKSVGAS